MNVGIYIQVPFCQTKCTYCNFYTGVVAREKYAPYADAVRREIVELATGGEISSLRDAVVDTVYFGGGTPSLLEPSALAGILDALRRNLGLAGSAGQDPDSARQVTSAALPEITLEGVDFQGPKSKRCRRKERLPLNEENKRHEQKRR